MNQANAQQYLISPNQESISPQSIQDRSIRFTHIKPLAVDISFESQWKIDIWWHNSITWYWQQQIQRKLRNTTCNPRPLTTISSKITSTQRRNDWSIKNKIWRGIRRYKISLRMDIQHTHIVHELTWSQFHILDKDYPGNIIKIWNKCQEFGKNNRRLNLTAPIIPLARHLLAETRSLQNMYGRFQLKG